MDAMMPLLQAFRSVISIMKVDNFPVMVEVLSFFKCFEIGGCDIWLIETPASHYLP